MTDQGLPLASSTWGEEERAAIERVLDSRQLTMGAEVTAFEAEFAAFHGKKFSVMVNSGSSANLLAIAALVYHPEIDLNPGDSVIVPTVSWSTTYFPLQQLGLKLKFVDIDRSTLNIDPVKLAQALTPEVKAVFCVNLLGNACRYDAIAALCAERGVFFLEDNCEAMGGRFETALLGSLGICGTFSTYYSHHICTMEGGLVVTDDQPLYRTMLSLRSHGWVRGQDPHSHLQVDVDEFSQLFRFVLPGYNLRPTEMQAAVGREQLKKLSGFVAARRRNAEKFLDLMADVSHIRVQEEVGESSWFGFSMLLEGALEGRRAEVVRILTKHGFECRPVVAGSFVKNPVIRYLDYEIFDSTAQADYLDSNGLFIGNHHVDISAALERLVPALSSIE